MADRIRIGVSACLLGERTRYDGGHKHDRYITGTIGELFDLVAVCPEVECGLPVPREPMRLEGDPAAPRLVVISSGEELTLKMAEYCTRKVGELRTCNICGFILKARSPSCGVFGVPVTASGEPAMSGRGLFAAAVTKALPLLPLEEEERMADPELRRNFLERVIAYHSGRNST
ncbi:putative protein [Geobacter sp. OR-1]|uniref:DUF523 domain-containing protein n=1 Tax=Geobacter sp. OR-1 TaxID=1266765 RepID=UPI000542113B|nr:DUF523 domain-containing protein [Geobacter sp. OR-1]GAM08997.1 putative protein [Geobacter sp. OR-1]